VPDTNNAVSKALGEYELGDTAPSDDFDLAPAPAKPNAPPRDPDTGRFTAPQSDPSRGPDATPPRHSAYLVAMAEDVGVSRDVIDSTDPERLGLLVRDLQRQQRQEGRRQSAQDAVADATGRKTSAAQTAPEPQGATPAKAAEAAPGAGAAPADDFTIPGLKESDWEPDLINPLKGAFSALARRNADLEARLAALEGTERARAEETAAQTLDRWFGKNEAVYGKGTRRDLAKDSPEMQRRLALLGVAKGLSAGSLEESLDLAHQRLYGGLTAPAPAAPQRKAGANGRPRPAPAAPDLWDEEGPVARPTQRQGPEDREANGAVKAMQGVRRWQRENNIADEADTPIDGFLD